MDKANCDLQLPCSPTPTYERDYWLFKRPENDQDTRPRGLDNLTQSLKAHMHTHHKLGGSNTASIYYKGWQNTVPLAHGSLSNSFMSQSRVTFKERRTALLWRMGCLWCERNGTIPSGKEGFLWFIRLGASDNTIYRSFSSPSGLVPSWRCHIWFRS